MPHTTKNLEGIAAVTAGAVDEAIDRSRSEVVLPSGRRIHLVYSLSVSEVGQTPILHMLGKGAELDAKVLIIETKRSVVRPLKIKRGIFTYLCASVSTGQAEELHCG